jgi:hypothetical protein
LGEGGVNCLRQARNFYFVVGECVDEVGEELGWEHPGEEEKGLGELGFEAAGFKDEDDEGGGGDEEGGFCECFARRSVEGHGLWWSLD